MPRNDRSDSLSVRAEEDPRRTMKGMQQEVELELGSSEAGDTGGVEHQSRADREGVGPEERPEEQATQSVTRAERAGHRTMAPAQATPGGPGDGEPDRDR